jgi:putative oxidoreductase
MEKYLGRYDASLYALLRFVAGAMFACHGAQKLFGVLTAGIIEFVGGLMIAIGFFASWAAFLASGLMAVAYFRVHAVQGFWPIQNKGELAVLYCFVFLYIAARGSGRPSVDAARRRR